VDLKFGVTSSGTLDQVAVCCTGNGVAHKLFYVVVGLMRRYTIVTRNQANWASYPEWDWKWVPVKGQWRLLLGQEGNRRSGVALAVHQTMWVYLPTGSVA